MAHAQKVLVVGDSHLNGRLGELVYERLAERLGKDQVGMASSCGSWALHWTTGRKTTCGYVPRGFIGGSRAKQRATPKLEGLLAKHKPDSVVVMLGTNFIGHSGQSAKKYIERMLFHIEKAGAECTWVGPPKTCFDADGSGMRRSQVDALLEELLKGRCTYITVAELTPYPTYPDCPFLRRKRKKGEPDGKHYDWKGEGFVRAVENWAAATVNTVVPPASATSEESPAAGASGARLVR